MVYIFVSLSALEIYHVQQKIIKNAPVLISHFLVYIQASKPKRAKGPDSRESCLFP